MTKTRAYEFEERRWTALDAHHQYYLDDEAFARKIIAEGYAVELDAGGKAVERPVRSRVTTETAAKPVRRGARGGTRAAKRAAVGATVSPPETKAQE